MAKRGKQPKQRPDPEEAATRDDVRGFIREYAQKDADKAAVGKRLGEFKVAFSDRTGLNRDAINVAVRMNKRSPEKRDDFFASLDIIRERMAGDWNQQEKMDFGSDTRSPEERLAQSRASARRSGATNLGEAAAAVADKMQAAVGETPAFETEEVETPPVTLDPPKEPIANKVSQIAAARRSRGGKLGLALNPEPAPDPEGIKEANEEIRESFNSIVD